MPHAEAVDIISPVLGNLNQLHLFTTPMLTFLLAFLYVSSMLFLAVHEDWLYKGNPHFLLGWLLAIIGTTSALALMVLQ